MPESMHDRYPSRSRAHLKDKIYDCAPILNYEVFVKGSPKDQLKEYVRGIRLAAPHLARFGATPQQVMMFNDILDVAIGQSPNSSSSGRAKSARRSTTRLDTE